MPRSESEEAFSFLIFMATHKRERPSLADEEDIIIRKIFLVTLVNNNSNSMEEKGDSSSSSSSSSSVVVYLKRTAEKLLNEGKPLKLCQDLMEQVLMERCFSGQFDWAEPAFPYLIGCYRRAYEEETHLTSMDISLQWSMKSLLSQAKKLAVCYCRTYLANSSDGFKETNDESPLLPFLISEVSCSTENNAYCRTHHVNSSDGKFMDESFDDICGKLKCCPPGFFKQFLQDSSDFDSLNLILKSLYEDLSRRLVCVSLLGNFQQPLLALNYLVKFPNGAKALVNHPRWLPKGAHVNGLEIEKMSILGPFFHPSILSDDRFKSEPDICKGLPYDIMDCGSHSRSCYEKVIRNLTSELHGGLEEVLLSLLKNNDTQENVFEYLAEIIKQNSSMANTQVDPTCASLGMFVNLGAVMLRLCKTFLDKDLTKRGEIDGNYVFCNTRLDFSKLTSLCASSEEVALWINKDKVGNMNGSNQMPKSVEATSAVKAKPVTTSSAKKYTFICECFFMTSRVLHLGLIKALTDFQHVQQKLVTCEDTLSTLKSKQGTGSSSLRDILLLRNNIELYWLKFFCYASQILQNEAYLQQALSFYRLMVVWLVDLVGGFKMPLPSSPPVELACLPEHFVEDAIELVIVVVAYPNLVGGISLEMDEFMNFIIMFMGSPNYIRNSYLRERMVEVLSQCIRNRSCSSPETTIFEDNQLCLEHLVQNLLKIYVDHELTGSPTQYEFRFRNSIITILEYLWEMPSHHNAWRQIAEEATGFYLGFLNSMINEIMFLLGKSLHRILGPEDMEAEMSMAAEWERAPFQAGLEIFLNIQHEEDMGVYMSYVMANVGMLALTSKQIIVPFLLPQMVHIVATMLNYILLHLVGLQGKSFGLKHPKRDVDRQEMLLKHIVSIYVNLARGDAENIFAASIAKDTRSYSEQLFTDAASVVLHEDSSLMRDFIELGNSAKSAASKAMDTEASLGEIPKDFLDPIEFTLMEDPVTLPSTKTVDRAVILRHLLNYNTDPFSALPLTQDMIIPNVELKAKIEEFIRSKQSKEKTLSGIHTKAKDHVRDESNRVMEPKTKDTEISPGLLSILQSYGSDDECS